MPVTLFFLRDSGFGICEGQVNIGERASCLSGLDSSGVFLVFHLCLQFAFLLIVSYIVYILYSCRAGRFGTVSAKPGIIAAWFCILYE